MALLGWHWSGLIRTALGWPPKHLCPVPVPTQLPHSGLGGPRPTFLPCQSLGSGEVRTGSPGCGAGALPDGGFGHQCFVVKLGVSPLLLARVLNVFHFTPSNSQTYNNLP